MLVERLDIVPGVNLGLGGNALSGIGLIFGQQVEEFRQGAGIFLLKEESPGLEKFDDIAVVIIKITEGSYLGGTGCLAGSGFRFSDAMVAKSALVDGRPGVVDEAGIVRTGLHAALAENTLFGIHLDDAALLIMTGIGRTNADTGSINAVVALRWIDVGIGLAEDGTLHQTYPDALLVCTKLHAVFLLAGDFTGLAVDAVLIIEGYCVIHNHTFLMETSVSCIMALPKTGSIIPSIISLSLAPLRWAKVWPVDCEPNP